MTFKPGRLAVANPAARVATSWPIDHHPETRPWHGTHVQPAVNAGPLSLADRFHRWCEAFVARLPLGLSAVVAPTFVGYCLINGLSFGADLSLLTGLHSGCGVPVPVAVSVAYVCGFALSYALNRSANFRSHAPVGPQFAVYAAVVAVNYLAFILGVTSVLAALGVQYQLSRLAAGFGEAAYMYAAMRWIVFRR